jgi:DNA-binding MarR family transcriptional regulator
MPAGANAGGAREEIEALALETAAFSAAFERWAHRKAVDAGATSPRLRLLYSVHCHGPLKMADLAEALTVTPRNITALVDALEAEGLVRRVPHTTDRRVTMVELSCTAERVESQFQAYKASLAGLFEGLDEAERRTLRRLLGTLQERMRGDPGCAGEVAADA